MTSPAKDRYRVPIAVAAVAVSLLISALAWWLWYQNALDSCREEVDQRRDDRAMWEFALAQSTDSDNSVERQAFVVELDTRLPRLECRGSHLIELEQGE